nr:G protein-coupled receptor [Proales similis]
MLANETDIDLYSRPSPVDCWKLNLVAVYCVVLFALSVTFNSLLLWIFFRYKELRSPVNTFIIAITILNLVGSMSEFPFVITSNLYCRWMARKLGCFVSGFIMYFVGCSQIYLMAAISFERFIIVYKPLSFKSIDFKVSCMWIAICLGAGALWALFPLVGWSYYSLEGALTSCSVEWAERSVNVISYNMTIFLFVFIVPLVLIVFTNVKLLLIIKSMPKMGGNQDAKAKKKAAAERTLTIIMMLLILFFVISWTPYALVCLYVAFIDAHLPPMYGTLPAMFAKSCMVWTSVLYIFSNKQLREKLKPSLFYLAEEKKEEISLSRDQATMKVSQADPAQA